MSNLNGYIEQVAQQVVKIQTPDGWGTGFIHYGRTGGTRSIATARHVIECAVEQRQLIRVWHGSRVSIFGDKRNAVYVQRTDADVDAALLAVIAPELPQPLVPIISPEERSQIKAGTEVGWLGYPALHSIENKVCYFSGRVSLVDDRAHRYLIDGTGVNGCSGGPAFCETIGGARILGALIQYIPNVTDYGLLPGLSAVVDVSNYKNVEDALSKIPKKRRTLTVKLDACPKCGSVIREEFSNTRGCWILVCATGCGELIDLLDPEAVNTFPGGPERLRGILHSGFRKVNG